MSDREKIDRLGGSTAVAKKVGCTTQRVQNWKTRGIPPAVKLEFPELFLKDKKLEKSAVNI